MQKIKASLPPRINEISDMKILLGPPYLTKDDERGIIEVLRSGQLSLGPKISLFEKRFASWIGAKYGICVSSGTTALHLCVRASEIGQGNEVITSPFSFISSSNSILYENAKPVFVDIDPKTLNIDPQKIEKAITKKTKAILIVHIFGLPADLNPIYKIAKKYNLRIIEDGAETVGATYDGKKIGSFGYPTVFAFYANKQMTTGEGGMITTNDKKMYEMLKSLTNQGRGVGDEWLLHERLGYNYRMNELNASLGITQLNKIDLLLDSRNQVAKTYEECLKNEQSIELLAPKIGKSVRSWFVYVIKLKENISRKEIMDKMIKKGIPTRAYLPSIHLQPFYQKLFNYKEGDFPVCESISRKTLALPFYTGMSKSQIKFICTTLKQILKST